VFGTLGYAIREETKRMKKFEKARDSSKASFKQPSAENATKPHPGAQKKVASRRFAAEYALYRTDYWLSTASFAKPLLLLVLTYMIIILGGIAYSYLSGLPVLEALWLSWTMVADPGAHGGKCYPFCK
jgi:hypothetical protein